MQRVPVIILCAATLVVAVPAIAQDTPSPPGAVVYSIWPSHDQVIKGCKLWVRMGLKNMGVAPAGVPKENTGHHHLLVNGDLPPPGEPIPNDRNHLHFGGGETEARLEGLPPGKYVLQLALGDAKHYLHDPAVVSKPITITLLPPC
jgi:hypothetical protein